MTPWVGGGAPSQTPSGEFLEIVVDAYPHPISYRGHCLGAAEETVRYSARPALAEIVLGGREVPVTVDSKGDSIGDTNYRGLSLLPGELPLTIGMSAK